MNNNTKIKSTYRSLVEKYYWLVPLGIVLLIYIFTAPTTVQQGDTGELVTNSFFFRLSHPPGYPLFHYLMYFFTHVISGTIFFRASMGQIIISVATLFIIFEIGSNQDKWVNVFFILTLAFSRLYWRYSILPDVFALNNLFVALIIYFYFLPSSKKNLRNIILIFCVALTNHHTILFLFPLVVHSVYESKLLRDALIYFVFGIVIFWIIYLSLFLFDHTSYGSWGELNSFESLVKHMIRYDYGVFQLTTHDTGVSYFSRHLLDFFNELSINFPFLIVIFLITIYTGIKKKSLFSTKKILIVTVVIVYILVFFRLSNLVPYEKNLILFHRFFLMPLLLLFILFYKSLEELKDMKNKSLIFALGIFSVLLNIYAWNNSNNLRADTLIEDHAINLVKALPKNSIMLVNDDTQIFSLYYVSTFLEPDPTKLYIMRFLLHKDWYQKKIKTLNENFQTSNNVSKNLNEIISESIIEKNRLNFGIYMQPIYYLFSFIHKYNLEFSELYLKILPGPQGINYKCGNSSLRLRSDYHVVRDLSQYNESLHLYSEYSLCDYLSGIELKKSGKFLDSLNAFDRALKIWPYNLHAQSEKCIVEKKINPVVNCSNIDQYRGIYIYDDLNNVRASR